MQSLLRNSTHLQRTIRSNGKRHAATHMLNRGRHLSSSFVATNEPNDDGDNDQHQATDENDDDRRRWLRDARKFLSLQEEEEIEEEPWKVVLARPARASWRAARIKRENPLDLAVTKVLKKSAHPVGPKHTRQTLDATIKKIRKLANRRHLERKKLFAAGEYYRDRNKQKETNHARPTGKSGDAESGAVVYGPQEAVANIKYRSKPNFYTMRRVLEEAYSLIGQKGDNTFQPRRILDFGFGCGSASAAALDVFGDESSIEWIHGVDASQVMREGGEHLLREFIRETNEAKNEKLNEDDEDDDDENDEDDEDRKTAPPPLLWSPRITTSAHLSSDPSMTAEVLDTTMTRAAFDLCLFSYTAAELPKSEATLAASALLWEKLKPGGLFVVVEPGTPDGFSTIRGIRNMLLDCSPPDSAVFGADECHVIAPCTHNGPCPLGLFVKPNKGKDSSKTTEEEEEEEGDEEEDPRTLARIVAKEENEDEFGDDDDDEEDIEFDPNMMDDEFEEEEEEEEEHPVEHGFCSFIQTFPNKSPEKFTYLVVQKQSAGMHPFNEKKETELDKIDVSEMLTKHLQTPHTDPLVDELRREVSDFARNHLQSDDDELGLKLIRSQKQSFGRIVRPPRKRGKHVIIDCCTDEGMSRHLITKGLSKSAPGLYQAAKKTRWGGYWLKGARKPVDEEKVKVERGDL